MQDPGQCTHAPVCGDGGAATSAQLSSPAGVAVDSAGNAFVADTGDSELRTVSPSGTISRIAGNGTQCTHAPVCGDGGAATSAQLSSPAGVAVDSAGNAFVADTSDEAVRCVGPAGRLVVVAFRAKANRGRVIVRYRLTGEARIILSVDAGLGRPIVVARARGRAGVDRIAWNRRLHGRRARHGSYELIVTATIGRRSVLSVLTLRL
ncbi:MAG: hypothetical protein M3Y17_13445 [Actinomycetota bacterium]|nr:hypothetical protein [Actinomycetota bacterium]